MVGLFCFKRGKTLKEIIKHTLRKVTLELVYQVVDERTTELIQKVEEVKKKQEDDFRYLVQKIDSDIGQVRNEISQLNQRIDTIIQMLMTIKQDMK